MIRFRFDTFFGEPIIIDRLIGCACVQSSRGCESRFSNRLKCWCIKATVYSNRVCRRYVCARCLRPQAVSVDKLRSLVWVEERVTSIYLMPEYKLELGFNMQPMRTPIGHDARPAFWEISNTYRNSYTIYDNAVCLSQDLRGGHWASFNSKARIVIR